KHKLIPGSGVNLEEFSLAEYPKENDELNLLFIGRIMKDKGIEELIKAAQVLKEQNIKVNFDAIGFYEGEYAKRVKKLDQSNLITFHGSTNDVKSFIKKSHAVILPSHHEGMANVLLEAASMGRPILASSIPGCQETFNEGITGYGFEPKNVNSLIQAIYKFLELTQEERERMGILGRKNVELEFDRKDIVETYISEIGTIIQYKEMRYKLMISIIIILIIKGFPFFFINQIFDLTLVDYQVASSLLLVINTIVFVSLLGKHSTNKTEYIILIFAYFIRIIL